MTRGLLIRKVKAVDREAVLALVTAAFERDDESRLVESLWSQHAIKIERVAEIGGIIVGYIAFSPVETAPRLDGLLLGLGPLAVAPSHQRQGIGAALVEEGLKLGAEQNTRLVILLGHPEYYPRFGFVPASQHRLAWAERDAGDAFQALVTAPIEDQEPRIVNFHPAFSSFA